MMQPSMRPISGKDCHNPVRHPVVFHSEVTGIPGKLRVRADNHPCRFRVPEQCPVESDIPARVPEHARAGTTYRADAPRQHLALVGKSHAVVRLYLCSTPSSATVQAAACADLSE